MALAKALKARGVDVIDCSSGGMSGPASLPTAKIAKGHQVPYAEVIRKGADIRTMAVGLIMESHQAERILTDGKADLIALGRALIANPNWAYTRPWRSALTIPTRSCRPPMASTWNGAPPRLGTEGGEQLDSPFNSPGSPNAFEAGRSETGPCARECACDSA